jgi:hypothetical protein
MSLNTKPTFRGWNSKVGAFGMSAPELAIFGAATLLCLRWLQLRPLRACLVVLGMALVWRFINAHTLPGATGTMLRYILRGKAWSAHGADQTAAFRSPESTDDEK